MKTGNSKTMRKVLCCFAAADVEVKRSIASIGAVVLCSRPHAGGLFDLSIYRSINVPMIVGSHDPSDLHRLLPDVSFFGFAAAAASAATFGLKAPEACASRAFVFAFLATHHTPPPIAKTDATPTKNVVVVI